MNNKINKIEETALLAEMRLKTLRIALIAAKAYKRFNDKSFLDCAKDFAQKAREIKVWITT